MNSFDSLSSKGIIFYERPNSIPYNYRITYRVAVICLMIKICSPRKGCPLVKLHVVNDGLEDNGLIGRIKKDLQFNRQTTVVRFDSALNRAFEYALSDNLIVRQGNGTYKLTKKGREFVEVLMEEELLLKNEKERLKVIYEELDDNTYNKILERWGANND